MQEQSTQQVNYNPQFIDPLKTVCKLWNNKIVFSKYHEVKQVWEYYDEFHKLHIPTQTLQKWNYSDYLKRRDNYRISLNRTKRTINKLSELNKFSLFLTMTFNEEYVNRKNPIEVHEKYRAVMKRLKYKFGKVEFLSVGEYHKDKAIHYHIMINFEREPHLKYRGRTKKGNAFYHLHKEEKFNHKDCFLTFEKLENNCTHYLTKYITKDNEQPYSRRFGCSRGLKRPQIKDIIYDVPRYELKQVALTEGFSYVFENQRNGTIEYTRGTGDRQAVSAERDGLDSFNIDIKGEKEFEHLSNVFYSVIEKALNCVVMTKKVNEMCRPLPKLQVEEKSEFQQLNFSMLENSTIDYDEVF